MPVIKDPLRAIRVKCVDCSAGSYTEVKECPIKDCSLYPFRFGTSPFIKKQISEEEKEKIVTRLQEGRKKKYQEGNKK